ncbi:MULTISPECIES: hypothetical protein [unclassified Pseudomonas]|uniref:hypothetical protein n=1 Tax=unclassified Pseudomonas TaxID=196821 RepID=UPI0015A13C65|nr:MULTISPECIES: hypothetical protein [unclassified Pseudomonas]NWA31505.1 hypothetical protein [Pseudomonas sp. C6002]NWB64284.1 hypothetical protein [Pseudomonas sp. F1002]
MILIPQSTDIPEAAVHKALSKLSWKLLKKEIDKFPWYKNPLELLDSVMRCDSLINKRKNLDKAHKRNELFNELTNYLQLKTDGSNIQQFKKKLNFFSIIDECFSEILAFEGELLALKDLVPKTRAWAVLNWYVGDANILQKKIEEQFLGSEPVLFSSISVTGESGEPVDPSSYHAQQVGALGSAILMEAYRNSWFDDEDTVVIPDKVEVSESEIFKSGSIFYNANIWALFDDLQEQVRFLGRDFLIRHKDEYADPPENFKFGIEFGKNTDAEIFDYIAGTRNNTRESSNFFSLRKDKELNSILDATAAITGSNSVREHYLASYSLSMLLNYDITEDETIYEGLKLTEWIDGFCGLREYCIELHSSAAKDKPKDSELLTFSRESALTYLQSKGMSQNAATDFIKNVTFHRKSRDLFDSPLIKTSSGYAVVSDILLSSVISRAIASNILSRKGEFKLKGAGLENTLKDIFRSNGIEAVSYKRKFPEPEGEYEYDTLVLWENKLFVMECKNRWLCEGRPVAIHNYLKQTRNDIPQVERLVAGLRFHPEMISAAFGRQVSYDEIIPCVVGGLPHAMLEKISNIYFTDISVISRFFSKRHFEIEYGDEKQDHSILLYDQWNADTPSTLSFLRALSSPVQVILALRGMNFKAVDNAAGSSIYLKCNLITSKHLNVDDYKDLIRGL